MAHYLHAMVTTGRDVDPLQVAPHPREDDRVRVVRSAPLREVLGHASAVITHGGHGTMLKALAYGKPVLCLPMGLDRPDNAARLQSLGAGIALSQDSEKAELVDVVTRLINDPAYHAAAEQFSAALAIETASDPVIAGLECLMAVSA